MAFKFLKTGAESVAMAKQAEAEKQKRMEEQGKMFRFWIKPKEEARITFVDGEVSAEGFLCPPRYYEHNLFLNGSWNNYFVCPEKTNPDAHDSCPICESGDRPSLVALFTIIDHRQYKSEKTQKIYLNTRKILAAKPKTFEILNKLAQKFGGLAGHTFDVSRTDDKDASVGSVFIPIETKSVDELKKLYVEAKTDPKTNTTTMETYFLSADYEKEIVYRTGDQLRALGLGKPAAGAAVMSPGGQPVAQDAPMDYSKQL